MRERVGMKGLIVNGDGKVVLASDIPMPEIDDYQVITRTIACGICNGTDLKLAEGKLKDFTATRLCWDTSLWER